MLKTKKKAKNFAQVDSETTNIEHTGLCNFKTC